MKTNPNDAAFARTNTDPHLLGSSIGLTKLEFFAGLAMQGLLAKGDIDLKDRFEATAIEAVAHAKVLIDELNNQDEEIK